MLKTNIILLILFLIDSTHAETWIKSGYWHTNSEHPLPDIDAKLFTHLFCAFAGINTSNHELYIWPEDEHYFSSFTDIVRRKNPSAKTFLSILAGEAANSSTFFETISQSSTRESFIKSSIISARQNRFNGLYLCNVLPSTPADMTNMEIFLDEWRKEVSSESRKSGTSPLILTIGVKYTPLIEESNIYPINSITRNIDWVNVLAFDYYLSSRDRFAGAHAALYYPSSNRNTDYGIKQWISRGLPAKKLVLGLPYHGYAWTLENPKDSAIGAPAKGPAFTEDGSFGYRHIQWSINSYGVKSEFNSTYVVNYCTIGSFWIGYDDVEAIKVKVSYAKEKGLLGYIAFQIPNDDENWSLFTSRLEVHETVK